MKKIISLSIFTFVFSILLKGQNETFLFNSTTSNAGSSLSNWVEANSGLPPTTGDFLDGTNIFDCDGYNVDLAGVVLGNPLLTDASGGGSFYNTGVLYIRSSTAPSFQSVTFDFLSYANEVVYDYSSGDQALIINAEYRDVTFSNGKKMLSTGTFKVNNVFKTTSALMFDVTAIMTFNSTASFNFFTGTEILIKNRTSLTINSVDGYNFYDYRTTKSYPEKWTIVRGHSSTSVSQNYLYPGTYGTLTIQRLSNPMHLSGNIIITGGLDISSTNSAIGKGLLSLNGYSLEIQGSLTTASTGILISGSTTSSLTCGASGTLYFNQSGTDNFLKNITINNSKTVSLGNQLYITSGSSYGTVIVAAGSQLNSQGYLTLKADASGTARIGESNGVINGEYTAETYLPATGRKYRFLASPVVNGTAAQWRNNGSSSASANIGIQITGSGTGFDNSTTNNPSAFWYDESKAGNDTTVGSGSSNDAGWTALTSGSQTLDNGKGYRVLVRGDRTISLTSSTPGTINPTTIWVKGTYPGYSASSSSSQPVVVNVTKTGTNRNSGINLIGNPYPSTIDWNAVTRSANVDAAYITYDPGVSGKGWTAASRYRGWNGSTGGAGRYIAAGQGFMVYTTGSGTVTFEENDKSTGAAGNFFTEKLTNHIIITMAYDSAYLDEAYLHFRDDASNNKDQYDLVQMINPTVNVATLDSNGQSYNINSLGKLEGKRVVPINLTNNPVADYKFKFNDLGTFANHRVFLNDKFTNKLFEVFEGNEYPISITSDPLSTGKNRLELVFEPVAANLKRITDNSAIHIQNNPVKDILILNIESSHDIGDANIEIFNTNGQLVSQSYWGTNKVNTQVNTSKLAQGIYFINITSKNYSQTIKFTKN